VYVLRGYWPRVELYIYYTGILYCIIYLCRLCSANGEWKRRASARQNPLVSMVSMYAKEQFHPLVGHDVGEAQDAFTAGLQHQTSGNHTSDDEPRTSVWDLP
jgi:hypothetical protein